MGRESNNNNKNWANIRQRIDSTYRFIGWQEVLELNFSSEKWSAFNFFSTRIHAHQTILRIRYTSFKVDDVELEKLQNYTRTRTHLVHTRWNDIEISFWWNFKSSSLQDNVMNRYNTHIIHMCIQLNQELLAAVCRLISRKISLKPVHKFALRVKVSAGLPRNFLEFKSIFNDKFTPINRTKCLWYNPLKWVGWVRECVRVAVLHSKFIL